MTRRTLAFGAGIAAIVLLFAGVGFSRSGIAAAAHDLPASIRDARAAGLEPDPTILVTREATPRRRERERYTHALIALRPRLPSSVRGLSPAQRAALRPAIVGLRDFALAAEGGSDTDWRRGYDLTWSDLRMYRKAIQLLTIDAEAALRLRNREAALEALELANTLARGYASPGEEFAEINRYPTALWIGRPLGRLMSEKGLSPHEVARITRLVEGPVFRHSDDRIVLSHRLSIQIATVVLAAQVPLTKSVRFPDPPDRLSGLGRLDTFQRAWQQSLIRPYAEVARALPADWTDFDRYRTAYAIFARPEYHAAGLERLYAREMLPDGTEYVDAILATEGIRRVLTYALAVRRGEYPPVPRDPCGPGPLAVRPLGRELRIWSRGQDRRDDGGRPLVAGKGDFVVTVPRP
ncbi:hypothetical protein EON77_00250 [bacterium]|nr:MAG: hypothetical protein EON77_00250 [bacterium]